MAFSKARRLSDFIAADGTVPATKFATGTITSAMIADTSITPTDLHTSLDLTGKTVTVATASGTTNTTAAASTAFVQQELTTLIGGAPSTLNDLNELAAAINDDANYNSTLTTALATKLPLAGGTLTGDLNITSTAPTIFFTDSDGTNQNTTVKQSGGNFFIIARDNTANAGIVFAGNASGTYDEYARFKADGNFGIGTNNPSETLELTRLGKIGFGMNGSFGARIGYFDDGGGVHGFHVDTKHSGTTVSESRFVVRADSGNVGIGTTSPSGLLDIKGNFESVYALKFNNTMGTDMVSGFRSHGGNGEAFSFYHDGDRRQMWDSNGSVTFENGSNVLQMYIGPTGNVGIGTTDTYSRKFVVQGAGDLMMLRSTNAGAGGAQLDFIHDSASAATGDSVGIINFSDDAKQYASLKGVTNNINVSGQLHFGVRTDASNYNHEAMVIDNTGSVGIGTTSPATNLHVHTTSSHSEIRVSSSASGGGTVPAVSLNNTAVEWGMGILGDNHLHFRENTASYASRLTIADGGSVGIGTTGPTAKLHVATTSGDPINIGLQNSERYWKMQTDGGFLTFNDVSAGDLVRMTLDTSGIVTMPYQPAFKVNWGSRAATGSGRLLSTNASDTVITGRDEFNTGSHFSTATGKFTAPVAGTYLLGFQAMRHGSNGASLECRIKKNGGAMWARAYQGAFDQAHQYWSIVTTTKCAAGDYFQVYIGPSTSIYDDDTYFYGHLIG